MKTKTKEAIVHECTVSVHVSHIRIRNKCVT